MTDYSALQEALADGSAAGVKAQVKELLAAGVTAEAILNEGLIPGMGIVGTMYETGEIFVPEMMVSARAMKGALEVLEPLLVQGGTQPRGRVAIGSIKADMHDMGKNLVAIMLKGSGYEIEDLGVDVPAERFVQAIHDGAQVVAMSALLTTTMANMITAIQAIEQAGLRDRVRIIVGGAPITQEYADEIGADGFSPDASSAVRLVDRLLAS
jgi:5-methyltetrahydrofolate--homocysteine methyltransferase